MNLIYHPNKLKAELTEKDIQIQRQTDTHAKITQLKKKSLPDLQSKQFDWRQAAACILGDITEETGSKQWFPHFRCLTADDTACAFFLLFFFKWVSLSPRL